MNSVQNIVNLDFLAELPGEDELALDQPLADNDAVPNAADDSQFDEIANDEDEVEDPPEMMEDPDELEKLGKLKSTD